MSNPFAKYAQPAQGTVFRDPYAGAEESRANDDQRIQQEQLNLARERERRQADNDARQAAMDALTRSEKSEKLNNERTEQDRLEVAQAAGIQDQLYAMRNVISAAKSAKEKSRDLFATGFGAQTAAGIGGTAAADVEGLLNTVSSNTAFDRLQKMREQSKTGGALGAVSERELSLLRDTIASLSQSQSDTQFRSNMDKVIAAYERVYGKLEAADTYYRDNGSLDGFTPPTESEISDSTGPSVSPQAAGAGATETSVPVPAEMQEEWQSYIADNWGNLDAGNTQRFREQLHLKYDYPFDVPDHTAFAKEANEAAASGAGPNVVTAIPDGTQELSALDQVRNNVVSDPLGTAVASYANSAALGLPDLMTDGNLQAAKDLNPASGFMGDLAGAVTGTVLTGGALGAGAKAAGAGGKLAQGAANPLAADALYGAGYGANTAAAQGDSAVAGALIGTGGAVVGDRIGRQIGRGITAMRLPKDTLSTGERALADTVNTAGNRDEVADALMRAESLGVPMTPADASPELRSLAGSAVRFSPEVAGQARDTFYRRNQGQLDRLSSAVERDLGPVQNIPQRSEDLLQQARAKAGPLYEQAYAAPGVENVDISDLVDRPTFSKAMLEAIGEMQDEGLDPSAYGMQTIGDSVQIAQPSWQTLDYLKRGLDNVIEGGTDKINGASPEARRAVQMKNMLLGRMDEANPDYAAARASYAGPASERSNLARGENALRADPNQLGVDVAKLTPEQVGQMQLGYQGGIMSDAERLRNNSNPWAKLNTPRAEGQMQSLYGDDADIARLLDQRDLELQLAGSANNITANSLTAEREIADEFFKQQPGIGGDLAAGAAETALYGGPFLTVGKRIGDKLMRQRREAKASAANRQMADEIGPLLLGEGGIGEIDRILTDSADYQAVVDEMIAKGLLSGQRAGTGVGVATTDYAAF